jgi:hypothetical protein
VTEHTHEGDEGAAHARHEEIVVGPTPVPIPIPTPAPAPAPIAPGATGPPISVAAGVVQRLTMLALGAAYTAPGQPPPIQVVWQDSSGEVLLHIDQTKVVLFPGLVLIALTLESDETGAGELVVPFAVGTPTSAAGMVASTESQPRGPQLLVDRWGQSTIAAAWQALLDVCHRIALQGGLDAQGARLIPGAITCDGTNLTVTPQARFATDQVIAQ